MKCYAHMYCIIMLIIYNIIAKQTYKNFKTRFSKHIYKLWIWNENKVQNKW